MNKPTPIDLIPGKLYYLVDPNTVCYYTSMENHRVINSLTWKSDNQLFLIMMCLSNIEEKKFSFLHEKTTFEFEIKTSDPFRTYSFHRCFRELDPKKGNGTGWKPPKW